MPFSTYKHDVVGHASITPSGPFVAGSYQELSIVFTAGKFGIDDTGSIKLSWRSASDSSAAQMSDPKAPNYTTAEASNGAVLAIAYNRNNMRPWVNTVHVRVTRGFLREGDTITLRMGDRRGGSPGYRLQTAVESEFHLKMFVDAFATYDFVELDASPVVQLVPGPAARFKAILPTLRRVGDSFRLAVLAEDRWGNVSDKVVRRVSLRATSPVEGLPASLVFEAGDGPKVIEGLAVREAGDLWIDILDDNGALLVRSNPLRIVADADRLPYWGDLHGQSGETVGSGTAAEYFHFAKHKSFIDIVGHQANDFQVTDGFWAEINRLSAEYDKPGEMVALPGYEWSGNTGMGGDRNVFFAREGRPIRRSSSVLLAQSAPTDCHHVSELFEALQKEDAVLIAHVGGRYADIAVGHDGKLEPVVEIHSCWGTFEWLLHQAFDLGHRVGLVCHSDDHKGRPGAAYPGASQFGALGGLTCYAMPRLDRPSLLEALRSRRTYGTTGTRLLLDVKASLPEGSRALSGDPKLSAATTEAPARQAGIGEIVRSGKGTVALSAEVVGSAPIERMTFFNGREAVAEVRGYSKAQLGNRVRVLFEGAEYRGRGRETFWRGTARLMGNRFTRAVAINHFNADKMPRLAADGAAVEFDTVTTGNFSGFDMWLDERDAGEIDIVSNMVCCRFALADIGLDDTVVDLGGLGRRLRVFRLPDVNATWRLEHTHAFEIDPSRDNPLYVRVTQEDGHQAWTSPVYVIA